MKPECPHYIAPRYLVDPDTDEDIETAVMCKLLGDYCMAEQGYVCDLYRDFLKEEESGYLD